MHEGVNSTWSMPNRFCMSSQHDLVKWPSPAMFKGHRLRNIVQLLTRDERLVKGNSAFGRFWMALHGTDEVMQAEFIANAPNRNL